MRSFRLAVRSTAPLIPTTRRIAKPRFRRERRRARIAPVSNFLDCVRSRERCNCDIETGHRSTTATLIANIAHQTRSYLEWDAQQECFTNNGSANKLLDYEYRAPYKLPD